MKYTVRRLVVGCLATWMLCLGVAPAQVCTPDVVLSAVALGAANKEGGTCGSDVIADGGFEAPLASSPWDSYSKLYGSPICDPACATSSAKEAYSGDGFVGFFNHPSVAEFAYIEQTITIPIVDFAYGSFYLRGSADGEPLDFTVSVDGFPLLNFTIEFTSAYTEYIPLAYDLTDYLDGQEHTIRFSVNMDPGTQTWVYMDDVCIEAIDFDGGTACDEICSAGGTDTDLDGAPDACEVCRGTNPNKPDSDGDGMDDNFEALRGLNPLNPTDASFDPDGDGLSNFDEFVQNSNPFDRDDPNTVRFVAHNGTDLPTRGSESEPWQTIQYALDNTPATPTRRATIILLPGHYFEDAVLKPYSDLRASRPLGASIVGTIVAADHTSLNDLAIGPNDVGNNALEINNVGITVRGCAFDGYVSGGGTGVRVDGAASGRSLFVGCRFEGLDIALDIYGAVPGLRTSRVAEWNVAGIWIRPNNGATKEGGIGDVTSAEVGFNQFVEGVNGPAVRYERDQTFVCELNYWGTVDPDIVPTVIQGNADYIPFLASAAILPAGIFCTVINGADQSRVTDASVFLDPSFVNAVTANTNGVYNFGAVSDGRYTVRAVSATLGESSATVTVGSGEIGSAVLVLGDGSDPNPNPGCGCNNAKTGAPGAADLIVAATALLSMIVAARATRPTN